MLAHFGNINYLQQGNPRQQAAWNALTASGLFSTLQDYTPLLAGTIPIEIDIPGSDLDVICCFTDTGKFIDDIKEKFGHYPAFSIYETQVRGIDTVIANFLLPGFEIEIFGQPRPSEQQEAWKHMLVEHQLLQIHGETFRQKVVDLKLSGIKTEPAFAQLLGLPGNPYEALLQLCHEMV